MWKWLVCLVILFHCAASVEGGSCVPGQKKFDECKRLCVCSEDGTLTQCTRKRKEFTSMSDAERSLYIQTLKTVSTNEIYKKEYDDLITLHIRHFMSGIHNMKHFLTWHRWYLLQYENLLRKVDCTVTVSYWDWSITSGEPWGSETDDLWYAGSTGFGGDGDPTNNYCVSDGPFAEGSWQLVPAANPGCQRRSFYGNPPDSVAVAELLDITAGNFTDFEVSLRINFHDTVHCLIGGTMCSLDSSCAPEFILHHAFIDKIWADWQEKSHEHKTVYFSSITDPLPATYGVMPLEVIDNNALPGGVRVDYLDVNDTETETFVKRIRKLKPERLQEIPRPDFDAINEESLKLFHVSVDEVERAKRKEKRFRPKIKKDRNTLTTRKGKRIGLEEPDLEIAESGQGK
ncbi:uncharacterized protein LOC116297105 [Actinia tenebrosa]|uniref:Uncharacterized protein LOC116297105 n=1 Tax=Actinia tenebrosa TaxID=6105 RepID=A0A6P8I0S2_ACTTE|nr:uncharacterized protein LOC116297105 [Actinia tenebrosa]